MFVGYIENAFPSCAHCTNLPFTKQTHTKNNDLPDNRRVRTMLVSKKDDDLERGFSSHFEIQFRIFYGNPLSVIATCNHPLLWSRMRACRTNGSDHLYSSLPTSTITCHQRQHIIIIILLLFNCFFFLLWLFFYGRFVYVSFLFIYVFFCFLFFIRYNLTSAGALWYCVYVARKVPSARKSIGLRCSTVVRWGRYRVRRRWSEQ